jgi:hypothetical protein
MTDRGFWVAGFALGGNVRRLMYQALIWCAVLGDEASGLGAALDAQRLQRLANALIDRVGRNAEARGDLFRTQMLVDEAEAVELTGRQPCEAITRGAVDFVCRKASIVVWQRTAIFQIDPHCAQH